MRAPDTRPHARFGIANRPLALLVAAIILALAPARARAAEPTTPPASDHATDHAPARAPERWYVMRMQGQRAGWMVDRELATPKGNLVNESEMHLKMERMGRTIEIAMCTGSMETPDGKLLEMRMMQDMGLATVRAKYLFEGDTVRAITEQLERSTEKTIPLPPGDWLTPRQAEAFEAEQISRGVTSFSYNTLDASAGLQLVHISHAIVGPTNVEVMGKTVPAIEWESTTSATPDIPMREFVDDSGEILRTAIDLAGIQIDILASDKQFALSDFDAPELMASTTVHPGGQRLTHPRTTRSATYLLTTTTGDIPDLPSTGAQHVERLDDTRARVAVNADHPQPATHAEIADARYREPSSTIDSADPAIIALVAQATKDLPEGASTLDRAHAIERFVHHYISSKSLGVGFATASEVCRTREGDCSEHAVLLAAMLRADGIPSRAVSGLVYVDQFVDQTDVFGYHMWAQGLIDVDGAGGGAPRWIDLDAAVYPFDATHIAISNSSLDDADVVNSMVSVADVLNSLSIDVESAK